MEWNWIYIISYHIVNIHNNPNIWTIGFTAVPRDTLLTFKRNTFYQWIIKSHDMFFPQKRHHSRNLWRWHFLKLSAYTLSGINHVVQQRTPFLTVEWHQNLKQSMKKTILKWTFIVLSIENTNKGKNRFES